MVQQVSSLEQIILSKVLEVLHREGGIELHTELRNEGLDSIKTIELIVNLEIEFDIQIDDQDLLIENFSSIYKISELLTNTYGLQQ
ncbi:Phosphopantetheine attachment site [Paenibacillus sp. OK060]|uniref:acyl carrier protein n=1 Tax=Paenibacillus sp. OK060 TaxID=1881034 RepID=UPI000890B960|nr:acyl carrier protein [Paenibacillus sp. OK060]SDM33397.1 Phosphopantetheine attachment site [Paenibacillus sp. OK060]